MTTVFSEVKQSWRSLVSFWQPWETNFDPSSYICEKEPQIKERLFFVNCYNSDSKQWHFRELSSMNLTLYTCWILEAWKRSIERSVIKRMFSQISHWHSLSLPPVVAWSACSNDRLLRGSSRGWNNSGLASFEEGSEQKYNIALEVQNSILREEQRAAIAALELKVWTLPE